MGVEDQKIHPTIVNEAEEYAGGHENINKNKPDENTFAYVSDISVST